MTTREPEIPSFMKRGHPRGGKPCSSEPAVQDWMIIFWVILAAVVAITVPGHVWHATHPYKVVSMKLTEVINHPHGGKVISVEGWIMVLDHEQEMTEAGPTTYRSVTYIVSPVRSEFRKSLTLRAIYLKEDSKQPISFNEFAESDPKKYVALTGYVVRDRDGKPTLEIESWRKASPPKD